MRIRLLATAIVITLATGALVRADYIKNFDAQIKVLPDATLDVTETIDVVFETPRHGIYRIIPVVYERNGNPFSIDFRLDSVTDEARRSLTTSTSWPGHDVNMRIGDADVTLRGEHEYRIHYIVRRAVNFFSGAPEVYWNVTGNEWPYPIQRATATIVPPDGVKSADVRTTSFVGAVGSTASGHVSARGDNLVFNTDAPLQPGQGFTIVAGLPAGSVTQPSFAQELWWFVKDWWPVAIFPLLALGIVYSIWHSSGRDQGAGTQAVAVEFSPPKDLSPSEVGTLIDESCDLPDIVATLIDLAARGWLTIKELPTEKILFMSSKDYQFIRNPTPPNDVLKPHEQKFFDGLFDLSTTQTTRLSLQKEKFYKNISPIRDSIYGQLMSKNLFTANPRTVRIGWRVIGGVIFVLGILLTAALERHVSYGIGTMIAGVIVLIAAKAMPAHTLAGTRKLVECLSFKRFVSMVEKDRIKQMAMSDPTIFGRLLPYAMVLGVADQWAQAFAGLMTQPPNWYQSYDNRPFNSIWFMHDLGGGMRTMQRTFVSVPHQSGGGAGSGFSGFSSGGGFSGGGFGGGGGGSW